MGIAIVLNEEKNQQVLALGRLGWSLRRIQQPTRIRRETASAYQYDERIVHLDGCFLAWRNRTEGSGYADVALRDAIEQGLAEGPRMQVAALGVAVVGQYEPFGVSPDLSNFPTGALLRDKGPASKTPFSGSGKPSSP